MKILKTKPPRKFGVGLHGSIVITDCAKVYLDSDEQITFSDANDYEYDIVKKNWGYYATPSLNGRLENFKLKTALIIGENTKAFVLLVHTGKEEEFFEYLKIEKLNFICWLNKEENLELIKNAFLNK